MPLRFFAYEKGHCLAVAFYERDYLVFLME